jgi:hypothetical protein
VRIAKGVAIFWAWSTAIKAVQLAIQTYEAAVVLAKATQWLFTKSLYGTQTAAAAAAGPGGLAGLREGLNASVLGKQINGVTSLLGKAGMLGAALAVGVAIGSWLNETFELDDKISRWIAELTGVADKLGNRGGKQGLDPKGYQYLADGSIRRPDGSWEYKSPTRVADESRKNIDFLSGKGRSPVADETDLGGSPLYVKPAEPMVVSPHARVAQSITEHTETTKAEVTIKDESGKATVTEKPKGTGFRLILQSTGGF